MTCRTVVNKTVAELEEEHYLFYFEKEKTYSIAHRKLIVCKDEELVLGQNLSVKDGGKLYIGCLINKGEKNQLESIMRIQEKMIRTPETVKESGHKRSISPDSEYKISDSGGADESDDAIDSRKLKKSRLFESDDETIASEQEKVKRLSKLIKKKKIDVRSDPAISDRLERLEKDVQELFKAVEDVKNAIKKPKAGSALRDNMVESSPTSSEKGLPKKEIVETAIWRNDINLMNVHAPPKEPSKCAIKLLSCLFTTAELQDGILFQSKRSSKSPLDSTRVTKLFDVLMIKYGEDRVAKSYQVIVESCNQKCRDIRRKATVQEGNKNKSIES